MPRENNPQKVEVHVSCICIRQHGDVCEVLLGKRADWREIFGGYWECGGGQVHRNQTFDGAVITQMCEEFGLDVNVLFPFSSYAIEMDGGSAIIPGVRFICTPNGDANVKIDHNEIVDYAWSTLDKLGEYKLIPGLLMEIKRAVRLYLINTLPAL